jgi:hypothetical protein
MNEDELALYQKLTIFQKNLVDALINLGFKHKYFSTYELIGWSDINVSNFHRWSDVIKHIHEAGKNQKINEIQRVMGI